MRYLVKHTTSYQYQNPTMLSYNEAWMAPRSLPHQKIFTSGFNLTPQAKDFSTRIDFFGNKVAYFSIHESHQQFEIGVESLLERNAPANTTNDLIAPVKWREFERGLQLFDRNLVGVKSFVLPSPMIPNLEILEAYARISFDRYEGLYDAVFDLNQRIYQDFEYNTSFTTVATPLQKAAEARKGVCQDFTHVAIGCLRALGLPARYVSGYIETNAPVDQPKLVGADASHAWFSTFIPSMGWVDFDPTNNQIVKDQHITVAWGRDYQDVPPLKGVIFNSANHELSVVVEVQRIEYH